MATSPKTRASLSVCRDGSQKLLRQGASVYDRRDSAGTRGRRNRRTEFDPVLHCVLSRIKLICLKSHGVHLIDSESIDLIESLEEVSRLSAAEA